MQGNISLSALWQFAILPQLSMGSKMTASLDEPLRCTPPQYEKRANAREAKLLLEDRLAHFINWLKEQGFQLIDEDSEIPTDRTELELVMKYVNT